MLVKISTFSSALFSATLAPLCLTQSVQAVVLLDVDLDTVNQITINATTGASSGSITGPDQAGVYLANFYGALGSGLNSNLISGNLTNFLNPPTGNPVIYRAFSGGDPGLNIYSWSTDSTVTFTNGIQAFTGSATWSLTPTQYAEMLAGPTSGSLYFPADSSDDIPSVTLIGEWSKGATPVPLETDALPLVFSGLFFGGGVWLKRKRSQAKVSEFIANKG